MSGLSWQQTVHRYVSGLSRGGQSPQLNPCEKHGAGLSCGHHATTQSSLLVGTIPTSTNLSLKYTFAGIGMTKNLPVGIYEKYISCVVVCAGTEEGQW